MNTTTPAALIRALAITVAGLAAACFDEPPTPIDGGTTTGGSEDVSGNGTGASGNGSGSSDDAATGTSGGTTSSDGSETTAGPTSTESSGGPELEVQNVQPAKGGNLGTYELTVSGVGFTDTTTMQVGGADVVISRVEATQIIATVTGDGAAVGPVDVTVCDRGVDAALVDAWTWVDSTPRFGDEPAGTSFPAGEGTYRALALGQLSDDLALDVAVTRAGVTDRIDLATGDGVGSFDPTGTINAGARAPALRDFDGDGDIDLVTGEGSDLVLYRQERSGFATGTAYASLTGVQGVVAVDFDADLDPDVLVLNTAGEVRLHLNLNDQLLGATTLAAHPSVATPTNLRFAAGDVTGDGDPDILLPLAGDGGIAVSRGLPGASFAGYRTTIGAAGSEVQQIVAFDATQDGRQEAVAVGPSPHGVRVYTASGFLGDMTAGEPLPGAPTGPHLFVTEGDFDCDGRTDFAVADSTQIQVYRSTEPGMFAPAGAPIDLVTGAARDLATGDVTGDGLADLVVLLVGGSLRVVVLENLSGR